MTVDGDTSTSDTMLMFATGKAAARGQKADHRCGRSGGSPTSRRGTRSHARALDHGREGRRGPQEVRAVEIEGAENEPLGAHDRPLDRAIRRS
jgi:hypothetical protein